MYEGKQWFIMEELHVWSISRALALSGCKILLPRNSRYLTEHYLNINNEWISVLHWHFSYEWLKQQNVLTSPLAQHEAGSVDRQSFPSAVWRHSAASDVRTLCHNGWWALMRLLSYMLTLCAVLLQCSTASQRQLHFIVEAVYRLLLLFDLIAFFVL